jgi:hypothetical protein
VLGKEGVNMMNIAKYLESNEAPKEPVTDYLCGEENLYVRGLSGQWYFWKLDL